jgi:hypothetical protein
MIYPRHGMSARRPSLDRENDGADGANAWPRALCRPGTSGPRARARARVAVAAAVPGSARPAAATQRLGVVASHRPPRRSSRKYVRCLPRGRRVWRVPLRPPLLDTSAARIPTTPRTPQRLPRVRATDRRGQAVALARELMFFCFVLFCFVFCPALRSRGRACFS